jgi:glycosyltransferase involved in cell wall biosynthesis
MAELHPAVSVVIPCYNYGTFLGDALESLLAQEFTDWECIIVDDGSTDHSAAVANEYVKRDPRFRYVHQQNAGLSAARNAGLNLAQGKFLQFLDADDALAPGKLRLQHHYLEAHPEADLVYGATEYFQGTPASRRPERSDISLPDPRWMRTASGNELLNAFVHENFLVVSAPLMRTATVRRTGSFDTALKSYEDWHYWFRVALSGAAFHYWPEPGTESWIRYGHVSMMRNQVRMNHAGLQLRRYFATRLSGGLARYNQIRVLRLRAKQLLLRLKGL